MGHGGLWRVLGGFPKVLQSRPDSLDSQQFRLTARSKPSDGLECDSYK